MATVQICRLCLSTEDQVVPIFDDENLPTKILNCVSIKITQDDTLTKSVCLSCISQIVQWEAFYNTCQQSNVVLLEAETKKNQEVASNRLNHIDLVDCKKDEIVYSEEFFDLDCIEYELKDEISRDLYSCEYCSKSFDILFDYLDHQEEHNGELVFQCDKCSEVFHTRQDLVEHDSKHNKLHQFRILSYNFNDTADSIDLEPEDNKNDEFVYSEEFFDSDCIEYEFKDEVSDDSYRCEICLKSFDVLFDYLDHQGEHNGEPVFRCDKCSEVFHTRQDLVEHDSKHKIPCERCGKLILKQSMKLHRIMHTDKFKCPQCKVHCNSQGTLNQHIITVHTDIKNHICDSCGKCFSGATALRVHLRTHSDERLYPCKLCDYAGRTASAIYIHMSTHAQDTCVCQFCKKAFKSARNLNDHLRRVHSKVKKHCCTYCNKTFVDKYMLKVHLRCHTGLRPYKCSVCEKGFVRSDGLKEHMAIHGGRTFYDCTNCAKRFSSKRALTRHSCPALL